MARNQELSEAKMMRTARWGVLAAGLATWAAGPAAHAGPDETARQVLDAAGVRGGLVVHLGCGDGKLVAALGAGEGFLVHGLDADPMKVAAAREHLRSLGRYGKVAVDVLSGRRLPYVDNLVNLIVAEGPGLAGAEEMMRVLCPNGVALVRQGDKWARTVKPRPAEIDEWTHYMHDPSNNAVAQDTVVGPPRRLQWVGSPRYARHHDRMSSVSAAVSTGGRVFYIFDDGSRVSILAPPKWALIARDAFNGTVLWKRPIETWHNHLQGLKSGPALLPRRLVALDGAVYVTLGLDAPVTALDAATGRTLRTYEGTEHAQEILVADGVLYLVIGREDKAAAAPGGAKSKKKASPRDGAWWSEGEKRLAAVRAETGQTLWSKDQWLAPLTLAVDAGGVYFCDAESVVCLARDTGKPLWRSEPVPRGKPLGSQYAPTLVVQDGVVLFAGGETAAKKNRTWYTEGEDTITALAAATGKVLWKAYHPPSGYASPEDVFVADGTVWLGNTTSGRALGVYTGRDLHTGEVRSEFPPDVDIYWFHHRCYRGKATVNYLMPARAGTEFIDFRKKHWEPNHWVRGACLYGVMPCNGLLYAPQHPCACYLEAKLSGFNAVAPAGGPGLPGAATTPPRLQKGSAYEAIRNPQSATRASQRSAASQSSIRNSDWPTYRHDPARSGRASTEVPPALRQVWQTTVGGRLSSPVVAGGRVFLASIDDHTVHALDAETGKPCWRHTVGGRVDSPPTILDGRVLFGSADGYVYCLRASDGALAWRFRAAPADRRLTAFEQVESVWPVHGSPLVHDGVLTCVAGRSMFLDGGLRFCRLDPATGKLLSETVLNDRDETGKGLQSYVSWLNMPTALPDVLSSLGGLLYMRGQAFRSDGTRLPLKAMPHGKDADAGAPAPTQDPNYAHLFCPTGFLDDDWWHRTYWMYGSTFVSGWQGYYRAGTAVPAGRILVFDDAKVYGFGRKLQYFRWTTPIEHHLFAADKPGAGAGKVRHAWAKDLPLLARGLVLAGKTLYAAGPPDLVDEPSVFKQINTPESQKLLAEQVAAMEGSKGALLWSVSADDGEKLAELALPAPPVFDGLVAAAGRLYLAGTDGKVLCLGGQ